MIVAIVWFVLDPLHDGSLKIGDLVAFIEYSFHAPIFPLLANLSLPCILGLRFLAGVSRGIMDMPISIGPNENGVTKQHLVAIWNLTMSPLLIQVRRRSPVLHNISFSSQTWRNHCYRLDRFWEIFTWCS